LNVVPGEIVEISDDESKTAKVRVGGAYLRVPLLLVKDAKVGDWVLVESGVAIAVITPEPSKES